MNERSQEQLLQSLVDGELDELAEVALLRDLDDRSSLAEWRQLALMFLEDRLFRRASREHVDQIAITPSGSVQPARPVRQQSSWSMMAGLCLAAMLGVALGYGYVEWGRGLRGNSHAPVASGHDAALDDNEGPLMAVGPRFPENDPELTSHAASVHESVASLPPLLKVDPTAARPVGMVDLAPLLSSDVPVAVPVFNSRDVPPEWLQPSEPLLTPEMKAHWENRGFQVDDRQRLHFIPLENGQHILVPDNRVRVRYAVQ
ncbi:MAG: hypothetical protein KDA58_05170 [Planctomycetaceae bacterium]|nr:hypothetical protein [Planctomycetaceae bacterium]